MENNKKKVDHELAVKMFAEGKTQADIARYFGVTNQCIQYHVKPHVKARVVKLNRKRVVERYYEDKEYHDKIVAKKSKAWMVRYRTDPAFRATVRARVNKSKKAQRLRKKLAREGIILDVLPGANNPQPLHHDDRTNVSK